MLRRTDVPDVRNSQNKLCTIPTLHITRTQQTGRFFWFVRLSDEKYLAAVLDKSWNGPFLTFLLTCYYVRRSVFFKWTREIDRMTGLTPCGFLFRFNLDEIASATKTRGCLIRNNFNPFTWFYLKYFGFH